LLAFCVGLVIVLAWFSLLFWLVFRRSLYSQLASTYPAWENQRRGMAILFLGLAVSGGSLWEVIYNPAGDLLSGSILICLGSCAILFGLRLCAGSGRAKRYLTWGSAAAFGVSVLLFLFWWIVL
jgi:hypothetical protein